MFLTDDRYVPAGQRRTTLRATETEVLSYLEIEVPLVSNRDVTSHVRFEEPDSEGNRRVHWREANEQGPDARPDLVRIPRLRGSFEFMPAEPAGTMVVYEMEVDFGGRLPGTLVRTFIPSQMRDQMSGLRSVLRDLRVSGLAEAKEEA